MRTIFILLLTVLAYAPAHTAGTWTAQNSGVTVTLNDIFFVDGLNGWCVGDEKYILHTTDGGSNWSIQLSGVIFEENFMGLYFTSLDSGWACAMSNYIYSTADGGANWNKGPMVTPDDMLMDVFFIDSQKGWAVGGNHAWATPDTLWQVILKTTNGGINWTEVHRDTSIGNISAGYLWGVSFADSLIGIAVGWMGGWVLTTNDGGQTWLKRFCGKTRDLYDITHLNGLTFVAVGDTGLIVKTTNGGIDWDTCARDSSGIFMAVDFVDTSCGWLVGQPVSGLVPKGVILNTVNGGTNWSNQNSGTTRRLTGVSFVNKSNGWACGSAGTILKYYDPNGIESLPTGENINLQTLKAYPNPFSDNIFFEFSNRDVIVSIDVYNVLGQLMLQLKNPIVKSGTLCWDGKDKSGVYLKSGIYIYRANLNKSTISGKIIKLK